MKRIVILYLCLVAVQLYAQEYERSVGYRAGLTSGFSFKKFMDNEIATEALLSFKQQGIQIALMRETHVPALVGISDNIQVIYGFGGHVGYIFTNRNQLFFRTFRYDTHRIFPVVGLDAIVGAEFVFRRFPLVMGINIRPHFNLYVPGFFRIIPADTAFSISYFF